MAFCPYKIVDANTNGSLAYAGTPASACEQAAKFSHDKKIYVTDQDGNKLAIYNLGKRITKK
jgi:hypothetical protein